MLGKEIINIIEDKVRTNVYNKVKQKPIHRFLCSNDRDFRHMLCFQFDEYDASIWSDIRGGTKLLNIKVYYDKISKQLYQ